MKNPNTFPSIYAYKEQLDVNGIFEFNLEWENANYRLFFVSAVWLIQNEDWSDTNAAIDFVRPCTANPSSATYTLTQNAKECEEEKENHNFKLLQEQ